MLPLPPPTSSTARSGSSRVARKRAANSSPAAHPLVRVLSSCRGPPVSPTPQRSISSPASGSVNARSAIRISVMVESSR